MFARYKVRCTEMSVVVHSAAYREYSCTFRGTGDEDKVFLETHLRGPEGRFHVGRLYSLTFIEDPE